MDEHADDQESSHHDRVQTTDTVPGQRGDSRADRRCQGRAGNCRTFGLAGPSVMNSAARPSHAAADGDWVSAQLGR